MTKNFSEINFELFWTQVFSLCNNNNQQNDSHPNNTQQNDIRPNLQDDTHQNGHEENEALHNDILHQKNDTQPNLQNETQQNGALPNAIHYTYIQ